MKIDFTTFVKMYYSQAMVYLGKIENPATKKIEKDLEQVNTLISILALVQEKSEGNLNVTEAKLLDEALRQMQLGYAQATN
ncbi:DUF1844 domain-containing protein [Bacteroidota bacterium]